jgi:ABC-type multidrug transport system permease subunit
MISLGMLVASRGQSEEFANGLLNMFSWPMMFLSEVWFSLEGSSPAVKAASNALPLTHLVRSARAIMNDGAGWSQVAPSLGYMAVVTVVCMVVGSAIFQWSDK